jgi:hypothetical protein
MNMTKLKRAKSTNGRNTAGRGVSRAVVSLAGNTVVSHTRSGVSRAMVLVLGWGISHAVVYRAVRSMARYGLSRAVWFVSREMVFLVLCGVSRALGSVLRAMVCLVREI